MGRHQSYPRVAHFLWTFLLLLGTTINAQQIPPATRTIEIDSNLLCSAEGGLAQMDDKNGGGNVPMPCSSDSDCFPPANCHSTHKICCIFPLDQEAPPVGCPKGTRQLRNAKGDWLNCVPTKPGSCPGGALCYEDSLEPNQFRCCGKDPGEGCGIGQRVLRHENGSSQLCVPGGDGAARECPGNAICEWSFAIDRFQCCEPDNGCLDSEAPLFDANDEVLSCSPAHSQSCPSEAAVCRFNFWTASFQCCAPSAPPSIASIRRMIEKAGGKHVEGGEGGGERGTPSAKECPAGEIPYLLETAAVPDLAAQQQQQEQWCASDMDCPPMAHCHAAMGLCCGPPGECPRPAENPIFDEHGHIRLCSLQQPDLCPPDSKCRETVDPLSGLPTGQRVCCGSFSFQCAASGSPFPSEENPLRCELDNPITCPMDMLCQASNLPGVSICCRADGTTFWAHGQHHRNLCPRGWLPYGQLNIFCHPTLHGSCPGRSACILSPTSGQFVCCQPIGSEERRRMAMAMDAGGRGGAMVRKGNGAALSCPNPDDTIDTMQGGHPR